MAWYDWYRLNKKLEVVEKKEPTVQVRTGKLVRNNSCWGGARTVVDERNANDEYLGGRYYYTDHTLEVPLEEAAQMFIDYLGLQIEYEQARDETKGSLYEPKKKR